MGIFDKFTWRRKIPSGYRKAKIELTEEESEAVSRTLEQYAAGAKAQLGGKEAFVPEKLRDAMTAQGLTRYVEDLIWKLEDCGSGEVATLMDKATQAQAKAYAIHNLPVYLFQLAGMFELAGDDGKAKDFFRHFLRAQSEFKPDQIDTIFLNATEFDIPKFVAMAQEKVG